MSRTVRLTIAYDGGNYQGWQRQQWDGTIQGELEQQLALLCQEPITLHGAGRTDAGVHALAMVAHFLTTSQIPLVAFSKGLNAMLPADIRILQAEEAPAGFHSRFSALGKTYRYDFCTAPVLLPTLRRYSAHYPGDFEPQRLKKSLSDLLGCHDFSSFERAGSRDRTIAHGRGAVRTLFHLACFPKAHSPGHWSFRVSGDGFLRQMVRILVGTLIQIGLGKRPSTDIPSIIAAKDRRLAGPTAPPQGLFLEKIYYNALPVYHTHPL